MSVLKQTEKNLIDAQKAQENFFLRLDGLGWRVCVRRRWSRTLLRRTGLELRCVRR